MNKRPIWILYSVLSLGAGALLYGLYRQDTHIGKFIGTVLGTPFPVNNIFSKLAAWFLPDYLWMFSLTCTLFAVMLPAEKGVLFWCCLAFFSGVLWEVMQWWDIVSGTADLWDILVYSIAVFSAAIIKVMSNKERRV